MRSTRLVLRGLAYYWRSHVAVILGVATAVSVLGGALLVGDSVRGSLRALVLGRIGRTDQIVASAAFFRESLAEDVAADPSFTKAGAAVVPLVVVPGFVTGQESGRRVGGVRVYGVDDRFWRFHGVDGTTGPADREAFVSLALARELRVTGGESILVRVQRPTEVPLESLFGRKDDLGRTLRFTVRAVQPASSLGEFSLEPGQGDVRAVFVPLRRVQQELGATGRVNTMLVANRPGQPSGTEALARAVRTHAHIEDLGWQVAPLASGAAFSVGADAGVLDDVHAAAAAAAADGRPHTAMFTYLANTLRLGEREVPYSLVTAVDLPVSRVSGSGGGDSPDPGTSGTVAVDGGPVAAGSEPPIVLNEWAAAELGARGGERLTMDYFVWEEPGQFATRTTEFRVAGIVPVAAGDREMAPSYPGISDAPTLDEWAPPFPVDLRRIRPADEAYWERYRTTPKAFVPLAVGQRLWRSKYGAVTSVRVMSEPGVSADTAARAFAERLRASVDPLTLGLAVRDVRAESLLAARGATDFGEYFLYFSFFLVVSALMLAALFFKLGVEQRAREVGVLRALGFGPGAVRRLFVGEGLVLASAGGVLGMAGALGYASFIMWALRTWWLEAVGTTALSLHVSPTSLAGGAIGGVVAAVACIWWTLRSLSRISERGLLAGQISFDDPRPAADRTRWLPVVAVVLGVGAVVLLGASASGRVAPAGAFFGAGASLLVAVLAAARVRLGRTPRRVDGLNGRHPMASLGLRNASYRPGRSLLAMAVIASATFMIVSVDAFRRGAGVEDAGKASGVGGYSVMVETLLPVAYDPNSTDGREALGLFNLDPGTRLEPFRLRPGDDASCLNLYEPRNPRILARATRFSTRAGSCSRRRLPPRTRTAPIPGASCAASSPTGRFRSSPTPTP
jgi:putative ABC transport system permease protein